MPTTKLFELAYSVQGKTTIYGIILQRSTGYYLKSSTGAFAAAASAADRFNAATEHDVMKGLYQISEARLAWENGEYLCTWYDKVGATEDPSTDIVLGTSEEYINGDVETTAPVDSSAWDGAVIVAP